MRDHKWPGFSADIEAKIYEIRRAAPIAAWSLELTSAPPSHAVTNYHAERTSMPIQR